MDAVFSPLLSEADRTYYLRSLMHSFRCTYICFWLYIPQPNHHLYYLGGHYSEENNPPDPSSGSLARRLFDGYRREVFYVLNDHIPGMAFINNQPYRELSQSELLRLTSVAVQRQFYQTAVFMGCCSGEIEMGWANANQINMENAMMSWFSEYSIPQQSLSQLRELSQALDPNPPSSSSSSLRSLDSPDSSSFMFNMPTTSNIAEIPLEVRPLQPIPSASSSIQQVLQFLQPTQSTTSSVQPAMQSFQQVPSTTTSPLRQAMQPLQQVPSTTTSPVHQQAMQSLPLIPSASTSPHQQAMQSLPLIPSASTSPHQQAMQAFALSRNIQLPSQESEDAAMTRAILAVLTSPSSSTSSSTPNLPYTHYHGVSQQRGSAFKSYLAPRIPMRASLHRQNLLKRSITYYRNLNIARREHMTANRPTTTQLHHMISERKRREKINESFEALRKLLPPEAKKDKASVLTRTREYLTLLKTQVAELSQRNQQLEAELLPAAIEAHAGEVIAENQQSGSWEGRVEVRITNVSESTSEDERIINLLIVLRGECPVSDFVIRILEFLKQVNNANLMSVDANTSRGASRSLNRVILRLRIEGNEWDEAAFQEAVRRVVADLAQ
ncbi:putative transcription factor bHLH041 isoform X2 [Ricinus communis]|uniref:putative transcription factor bHLH041 isoform X2 n=1 Tax=Ricinus communis TaxID=3988 RepID=UPI00201B00B3|nr:putative transcription factor bHLH041 isoform X2 [Ricinus communis]